jgi:hypothetical protein
MEASQMRGKMLMLCISVVAVAAFATLPAIAIAAAASPTLEDDAGDVLAPHSGDIKAVSINLVFSGGASFSLLCAMSTFEDELTVNAGSVVEADVSTASFRNSTGGTKCATTFAGPLTAEITTENLPWCLKATAAPADTLVIDDGTCGTTPRKAIAFILHLFNGAGTKVAECTYERASLTATYNANAPLVAILSAGQTFTKRSGGILCPSTGTLLGSFTLTLAGTNLKMA